MADAAPTAEDMAAAAAAAALGAVSGGTKRPRSPLDEEEEEEDDESVEGPSLSELEAAADSAMYAEQTKICQAVKVESGAPVIYPYHRVRRIMKAEDQVQALLEKRQPLALGREAPRVMAKACELFTRSLSARAWAGAHRKGRKCLRRRDVGNAIVRHSEFDFLIDVRPTAEDGAQDIA
jgi:histone H3/H4